MHHASPVSLFVFVSCWASQEVRGISAYPYVVWIPHVSVFEHAQDIIRGVGSMLFSTKESILLDPRYNIMLRK